MTKSSELLLKADFFFGNGGGGGVLRDALFFSLFIPNPVTMLVASFSLARLRWGREFKSALHDAFSSEYQTFLALPLPGPVPLIPFCTGRYVFRNPSRSDVAFPVDSSRLFPFLPRSDSSAVSVETVSTVVASEASPDVDEFPPKLSTEEAPSLNMSDDADPMVDTEKRRGRWGSIEEALED